MEIVFGFVTFLIIAFAIYYQKRYFQKAREGRRTLINIFPENLDDDLMAHEDEDSKCIQIDISEEYKELFDNETFANIRKDINSYLASNKGSVEYSIIKDITDRHCSNIEQQIDAITPVPIYIGLCGTVAGIITGVVFLILGGGLKNIASAGVDGIQSLLIGVAIAMITTLVGVLLTIISSTNTKDSTEEYEREKNSFLSWVQVKLLPKMDGNMTTTLDILQRNLAKFNKGFYENTQTLKKVFSGINESYEKQADLIKTVQNLKINDIANANVMVLRELKDCTEQINNLQQFINSSGRYLTNIEALNNNLSNHYNRTQLIENMGKFFMDEVKQIEQRKAAISEYVADIDSSLKLAFGELKEHTHNEYQVLKDNASDEHSSFLKAIEEQKEALQKKLNETTQLVEELHNLSDVKNSMVSLIDITKTQGNYLEELNRSMLQMKNSNSEQISLLREMVDRIGSLHVDVDMPTIKSNMPSNFSFKIPKWVTITGIFTCLVIVSTCIYFIVKSIM